MWQKIKQDRSIGNNLKALRQSCGYTQEYVSIQLQVMGLSVSRELLSRMENGKYNIPVSVLTALKKLYKAPSYDVFFEGLG